MVNKEFLTEMNAAYHQLELKKAQITSALSHGIFELESGWYNGHYHKTDTSDWSRKSDLPSPFRTMWTVKPFLNLRSCYAGKGSIIKV